MAPPHEAPARDSDRRHDAEDVVVAGRGLVALDPGERVREGDGPGLVVEAAPLAATDAAASARCAADGLVVGDVCAEEDKHAVRRAGGRRRVAVEDAAAEGVPPVTAHA